MVLVAIVVGGATASAQTHHDKHAKGCDHSEAAKIFAETSRKGFQQPHNPQFIFTAPNNKFMLGIGATVTLRTSYDFMGAVGNIDFVPYDIAMTKGYANQQRVMMDASTSRIFLKGVINTDCLGRIVAYTDIDFRGGDAFSYLPRLRSAYIQMLGFTVGRDVTTFCDLMAAPQTIDFQGPNAYNFRFTEMIRYENTCWDRHIKYGAAAEVPTVNATYGELNKCFVADQRFVGRRILKLKCTLSNSLKLAGFSQSSFLFFAHVSLPAYNGELIKYLQLSTAVTGREDDF